MSRRYEDEQKELAEKIKKLRPEIEKQSSCSMPTDLFIRLVRKYKKRRSRQLRHRELAMVRAWGLEPQRITAREPKSRMSTNSIMPADMSGREDRRCFTII